MCMWFCFCFLQCCLFPCLPQIIFVTLFAGHKYPSRSTVATEKPNTDSMKIQSNKVWWHNDKNFINNHLSTPNQQHKRKTMQLQMKSSMKIKIFLRCKLCLMNWKLVIWSFTAALNSRWETSLRFFLCWDCRGTCVICSCPTLTQALLQQEWYWKD